MTTYLLGQLQLKYGSGNVRRFQSAMSIMREEFEAQNIRLIAGAVTSVGPLYEAWNLWPLEDEGHLSRAIEGIAFDRPDVVDAQSGARVSEPLSSWSGCVGGQGLPLITA
jgi:hypothetical protein